MSNAKITFDAPQVVGNLVVVTGRIDNCHLTSAPSGDATVHSEGLIDVSDYMKEVLAFKTVTTQPIDLHIVHRGTNLDESGGGFHNEVSVTGGNGSGMQIGAINVLTRDIAGAVDIAGSPNFLISGDPARQTLLGTGYKMGDIVTAQVPVASGTDRPKFRIMPAGAMARSYVAGGGPDFNHLLLCSAQPSRIVTTLLTTPETEERTKVYIKGHTPTQEVNGGIAPHTGIVSPPVTNSRTSIAAHAKFIIIGRR